MRSSTSSQRSARGFIASTMSASERFADGIGGRAIESLAAVGVDGRRPDVRVAQAITNDRHRHAGGGELGAVEVPEVVEADLIEADPSS
jgi:hypothetical protein